MAPSTLIAWMVFGYSFVAFAIIAVFGGHL